MEDSYVLQLLKPKFKDFHLCFCGFAECKPLHSYGPAARPNYILHYVMKGKGIYQVGETKYQLKEGQAFLIEPESLTFYQADIIRVQLQKIFTISRGSSISFSQYWLAGLKFSNMRMIQKKVYMCRRQFPI